MDWNGTCGSKQGLKGKAKFPALLSFTRHFLKVYFFDISFLKKALYVPYAFDRNIYFKFLKSLYIYIYSN